MKTKDFVTGLQHIGLPTANFEETLRFYQSLGFTEVLKTNNPSSSEQVAFLSLTNLIIEVYESENVVGKPGAIDHIALDVTNIEAAFEFAVQENYNLLDRAIQFLPFWEKGVQFFTILGPNGEKIEFSQKL